MFREILHKRKLRLAPKKTECNKKLMSILRSSSKKTRTFQTKFMIKYILLKKEGIQTSKAHV